jgi:UDP-N-acetylmuramoylalanine--D-glutamate ligase
LAQLRQQAAAVVVYGAAAEEFEALLRQDGYPGQLHRVVGLEQAVPLAAGLAKASGKASVLLSPACASFDQYSDFEARGDHFRALVAAL